MIIRSLTMENFRQYYGRQEIQFAQSNENKVVTIILGENGRGKTSIYRAIMLALFGDQKLAQDDQEADIYLANIKAVEQCSQRGEGAYCKVEVSFEHYNEDYTIERTYFAMKNEDGIQKEQLHNVLLTNNNTGEEWFSEEDIKAVIQKMIDDRVKHYFFFDGERIERLTRVSARQKREIAFGIKNLLKIDQVLKSKQVIQRVLSNVKKDLERHSTGDYKKAIQKMGELEEHYESLKATYEQLEEQKNNYYARQIEIEGILQSSEAIRETMNRRDQLELQLDHINKDIEKKFIQAKQLNKYIPLLIGQDIFYEKLVALSDEISGDVEEGITSQYVLQLVEELRCICGNTFNEESSEYKQLTSLANSIQTFEENKTLHTMHHELKQLTSYLEDRIEQIKQAYEEINQLYIEKEQIQHQLDEINQQLSESNKEEITKLNEEREQIIRQLMTIENEQKQNLKETKEYANQIDELSLSLKELERESGIHQQLLTKYNVLEKSHSTIERIIKKFETDLIEELELATKQNLHYLLDEAGRSIIQDVKITDDYTLEVLNSLGQPFLANISQGQRQVLSLSFISALAQVAGGASVLEMPLFMDTPFGRLSGQHQMNLIEYLPQICAQWILLVTDKEFGELEQEQFVNAGTIGKYYELIAEEAGVTTIKEIPATEYTKGRISHG